MADETDGLQDLIREAGARKALEPEERDRLLKAAGQGDGESQDRLVAAYLPAVVRLAATRADEGLSLPDLVHEGSIGLFEAVREFASSGETDFAAFADARGPRQLSRAIEEQAAAVRYAKLLVSAAHDHARTGTVLTGNL